MQSKQKKVNWNRIFTAVDAITNGYNNLFEVLTDEWNKSDYANPLEFRKAFVEEYVKRKVTKDPHEARAYANRVACEAGFRIRGKGAGRKVGKATNKPKASVNKPTKANQIDLSAMSKIELRKLIADAAALI
jgi:hypothetical protein